MREMIYDDIFFKLPFDTYKAHEIFREACLLQSFNEALDIYVTYRAAKRDGRIDSETYRLADEVDRTRGEFFIKVCEWVRSRGAIL